MNMPNQSKTPAKTKGSKEVARVSMQAMSVYAGPIPPASELKKYEEVLPGSADRILKMAEKQSAHRQGMEERMLDNSIKSERIGQCLGFAVFTLAIIAGFVLILLGKDGIGLLTALGSIAALVGLFIYDRQSTKEK